MSSSENESSSDEGRQQNGSKSKSSNDNCFKNEVEIKNDMKSLRKCPSLLTVEELTSPDYEAWIFATPGRVIQIDFFHNFLFLNLMIFSWRQKSYGTLSSTCQNPPNLTLTMRNMKL